MPRTQLCRWTWSDHQELWRFPVSLSSPALHRILNTSCLLYFGKSLETWTTISDSSPSWVLYDSHGDMGNCSGVRYYPFDLVGLDLCSSEPSPFHCLMEVLAARSSSSLPLLLVWVSSLCLWLKRPQWHRHLVDK